MTIAGRAMGVVSELPELRPALERAFGDRCGPGLGREVLLVGRPGDRPESAAWMLYESGDILLRRSRSDSDIAAATGYHLLALEGAIRLPIWRCASARSSSTAGPSSRNRPCSTISPVMTGGWRSAGAWCCRRPLPPSIHSRWRWCWSIRPSRTGSRVGGCRSRRSCFAIRDAGLDAAARHLALARTVLRHEVLPLDKAIGQVDELVARHRERIQLAAAEDIVATVRQLGRRAAP